MKDLNKYVAIYQDELKKGDIVFAYNELVKFVMKLRTEFTRTLTDEYVFGGILHGYMDYTYFYYSNDYLKSKKLKFGLVLNHREMRFELWLLGNTKPTQRAYWELTKNTKWNKNRKSMPEYAILEVNLVETPDFNDLDKLIAQIETRLIASTNEILDYLRSENQNS